jgi:hypothetical membrane protein
MLSVLTTQDPLWWHQHFSQLGTYGDASSRTFNTTVVFSGFFLATYGVLVAVALPARTGRRARRSFRAAITSAGLHLTLVGVVPIPVSPVMHDVIASGLGLSFLAIVATGLALPGRSRRFRRATGFCVALLAVGMAVLTAGFITLALFELVAFVSMGIWLMALPRALAYTGPSPSSRRLARRRALRIARAARRMPTNDRPAVASSSRPVPPAPVPVHTTALAPSSGDRARTARRPVGRIAGSRAGSRRSTTRPVTTRPLRPRPVSLARSGATRPRGGPARTVTASRPRRRAGSRRRTRSGRSASRSGSSRPR